MSYEYRDPAGVARTAVVASWVWLGCRLCYTAFALTKPDDLQLGVAALLYLLVLAVSGVLILRWFYRVNAKVHAIGAPIAMSAGWTVGSFFVPIACLFKPYQGLSQTWAATINAEAPELVEVPGLLKVWWGLWLTMNIVDYIDARYGMADPTADMAFEVTGTAIAVVLVIVLTRIMRELTGYQRGHMQGAVFA